MSATPDPGALLLTAKQRAIVEAVNGLLAVPEWRQIFTAERFEADMRQATHARDVARMARVGVAFLTRVGGEGVADLLDRKREELAKGGRRAAQAREQNPKINATRLPRALESYEDATDTTLTPESSASIRKEAAAKIGTSPSYLLRILKRRAKQRVKSR